MRKSLLFASTAAVAVGLVAAPASANAAARTPTAVTFGMSTTANAGLTISGKLTAVKGTVPAGKWLTAECYSLQQHKWLTIKPQSGQKPLVTKAGGAFSSKLTANCAHGYYRVRFPGDPTLAPSTSPKVLDKRINAMVFGWKVTPRTVRKGGYVYVSGTLKQDVKPGKYVPFKGQRVYLLIKVKGVNHWEWFAAPKTDAKGHFSGRVRLYKNATFGFLYKGDKTHYYDSPLKGTPVSVR
ncbi:hypothetical protein DZF91_10295 [Actinomadura logoneensis]|uniref:Calcium-binding protein n=1 Tax=Actinomadura logoneensis TaxID=2293572 RepID=A0A372JNX3_9ACTN|nr:hypothetical protein [Actinomadura logoneensis]RFU41725.1 hypothetical protein DZF91_10295 [Actinomadura logoneensis]